MNTPILTPEEGQALLSLAPKAVRTIGRTRIVEALGIANKLYEAAEAARQKVEAANFLNNAFWMAASGMLTEQMIREQPLLSDQQKTDLLSVVQLRMDAEQWREYCGLELPALPTVDLPADDLAANTELHTAEHIG